MEDTKRAQQRKRQLATLLADQDVSDYLDYVVSTHDVLELTICYDHHDYLLQAAQAFVSEPEFTTQCERLREIVTEVVTTFPELLQRRLLTTLIYQLHGGILP
ncbi:MAG: hypothetical protein KDN22_17785 [Verrucomicrobiae bacterium]|nr:hypothetical protein [Verrucomicrobiae bacterium]